MSNLSRELGIVILQFLNEQDLKETAHKLEQESGIYFNMKYFEDEVHNGNWDAVERYLLGFTKVDDNRYSMKLFSEIRKQKYLEAVDQENEQLSKYEDTKSARMVILVELKKLIEENPLFHDKLQFPSLKYSRLRTLINQSFNWQHHLCKSPRPYPDIKTLFVDHYCMQPNVARAPSQDSSFLRNMPKPGGFPPLGAHGPSQPEASLAGWMSTPPTLTHPAVSCGAFGLSAPTNTAAILKDPRTPPANNTAVDYSSLDSDHASKSTRPMWISDEVNRPMNMLPVTCQQNHSEATYTPDDLPKTLARTLNQGSVPMSMDFHPMQQAILLVGTNVGDIALWDVESRERLFLQHFVVWELGQCSMSFQNALVKGTCVSVNRIIWSPDGSLFGVAYSKHMVQIYSCHGGDDIRQHLEIDAHIGGVNDLAFSELKNQLCVITCGDDKTIKAWDATTGTKQYTFEGHGAPVYSVCPHHKESIKFILSTAIDGKIKSWLYDNLGSIVDYNAPGHWCTTMAYSADGSRLFSCGTSKEGQSYIVEWDESEGAVKRTYQGLNKRSLGVVQFDTTRNRYLAAGDEFLIKFWDMDNTNLLTTTDAEHSLPASPRIRFNKEGTFLAVSTHDNGIKILANADGLRLLRAFENRSFDASRIKPIINMLSAVTIATCSGVTERAASSMAISGLNSDSRNLVHNKPRLTDESMDKSKIWKLTEINEPAQCQSLRLMDNMRTNKISRLIYTNSGVSILGLASNAIHLLWKWQRNEHNPSGKATASLPPQLYLPPSGMLMANEITETNPEESVPCFALSKNDSYVISASGGKISIFNMMTFKPMTLFMPPPPAATFLAFHPQDNNIIAIGMDDSTIQIYDFRVHKVKSKLRGHTKRITDLAFSHVLNVLVSSGADAQICVWSTGVWERLRSKFLHSPPGHIANEVSETRIQFHRDQIHFLAVHETQIAIYEANKLECVNKWILLEPYRAISHATFSCDNELIYVSFVDATVCVFSAANLRLQCRINPAAYLPANISSTVYPLVIAAHPSEPSQFALGLTDGSVHVLEPLKSEGTWGVAHPAEKDSSSSMFAAPPGVYLA